MSDDIKGNDESLSPETAEIIKSLESEGHEFEGRDKPAEVPPLKEEKPKPEQPPEAKKEPSPEKEKEPEPKKEEEPEVEEKPKPKERLVKAVPVQKYNEERHKRQEAQAREKALEAKLAENTSPLDLDETVNKLSEKWQVDKQFVRDMLESTARMASKSESPFSKQELAELRTIKAKMDEQAELTAFEQDFAGVAKEFPQISAHRDKIKELAYTEGYERVPLRSLAIEFAHDQGLFEKGRKTAEKATTGTERTGETIDFDNLSEDQAKNLNDEQWGKYLDYQDAKAKKQRGGL